MNGKKHIAATLAAGILAWLSAQTTAQAETFEKCYGVVKAEKNDCASKGSHFCASLAQQDADPESWIYVPKGVCEKLVGGVTKERK